MSDANYQMLVEIGGIMDGAVPREGICTTADGVRWLCDRVQELKNELYETKRERDEAREDVMKLQDIKRKHEHEELVAAQENDRLKQERDEARELERVAIVSWEEEHQRALREGQRVVEAREQNAKLRYIAKRAIELAVQYYDGPCERDAAKLRAELDKLKEGEK